MVSVGTYFSTVDFQLPADPPAGVPKETVAAFRELYGASQRIIYTLVDSCGISSQQPSSWPTIAGNVTTLRIGNLCRFYCKASEDIAYGAVIALTASGDETVAINANANDATKVCCGFCNTQGVVAGSYAEFMLGSGLLYVSGLTVGTPYYLSTTNGLITATRITAAGKIEQFVGIAVATNTLLFNVGGFIQH